MCVQDTRDILTRVAPGRRTASHRGPEKLVPGRFSLRFACEEQHPEGGRQQAASTRVFDELVFGIRGFDKYSPEEDRMVFDLLWLHNWPGLFVYVTVSAQCLGASAVDVINLAHCRLARRLCAQLFATGEAGRLVVWPVRPCKARVTLRDRVTKCERFSYRAHVDLQRLLKAQVLIFQSNRLCNGQVCLELLVAGRALRARHVPRGGGLLCSPAKSIPPPSPSSPPPSN